MPNIFYFDIFLRLNSQFSSCFYIISTRLEQFYTMLAYSHTRRFYYFCLYHLSLNVTYQPYHFYLLPVDQACFSNQDINRVYYIQNKHQYFTTNRSQNKLNVNLVFTTSKCLQKLYIAIVFKYILNATRSDWFLRCFTDVVCTRGAILLSHNFSTNICVKIYLRIGLLSVFAQRNDVDGNVYTFIKAK